MSLCMRCRSILKLDSNTEIHRRRSDGDMHFQHTYLKNLHPESLSRYFEELQD